MAIRIHELGHVVFYVRNLERSVEFYRDVLGMPQIGNVDLGVSRAAGFSTGRTHHELLLIEVGGVLPPKVPGTPGLYHVGFKIGNTPDDIQKAHTELREKGVTILGASDHQITHSLYVLDPDGNELELYADVSDEWKRDPRLIFAPIKRLPLE